MTAGHPFVLWQIIKAQSARVDDDSNALSPSSMPKSVLSHCRLKDGRI